VGPFVCNEVFLQSIEAARRNPSVRATLAESTPKRVRRHRPIVKK